MRPLTDVGEFARQRRQRCRIQGRHVRVQRAGCWDDDEHGIRAVPVRQLERHELRVIRRPEASLSRHHRDRHRRTRLKREWRLHRVRRIEGVTPASVEQDRVRQQHQQIVRRRLVEHTWHQAIGLLTPPHIDGVEHGLRRRSGADLRSEKRARIAREGRICRQSRAHPNPIADFHFDTGIERREQRTEVAVGAIDLRAITGSPAQRGTHLGVRLTGRGIHGQSQCGPDTER